MFLKLFLYLFVTNLVDSLVQLYEGDDCTAGKYSGICLHFYECHYAIHLVQQRQKPVTCGFKGKIPIVCCPLPSEPKQDQNLTVSKVSEKLQESDVAITFKRDSCSATNLTGTCVLLDKCNYAINLLKKGQKPITCSFRGKSPLVCCPLSSQRITAIGSTQITQEKCEQYVNETENIHAYYLGDAATAWEFPHMAVLGFGEKTDVKWLCGGSLISPDFILTAAHCFSHSEYGALKWIRLGELDLKTDNDTVGRGDHSVTQTFPHPKFQPPSHYHDIGLVKIGTYLNSFSQFVRPACLNFEKDIPNGPDVISRLIGTGWGKTDFAGGSSNHLLKVEIDQVDAQTCISKYKGVSRSKLPNGILDEFQICAGDADGRDACQGDSGGPLQVKRTGWNRQYFTIVGVVSFGKACGVTNSAGVYTRVSAYIPWIESIVWPS